MRKCKTCGVDILHRGNRSQYCEKHVKEIRDKKVRQNENRIDVFSEFARVLGELKKYRKEIQKGLDKVGFDSRRLSENIEVD